MATDEIHSLYAVAEATFKVFKTEFANGAHFTSLEQLVLELSDYVHWFNNIRISWNTRLFNPSGVRAIALIILCRVVVLII